MPKRRVTFSLFRKIIVYLTIPTLFLLLAFRDPSKYNQKSLQVPDELKQLIRAFPTWYSSHNNSWCIPYSANLTSNSTDSGLIYVKSPKTGSSTITGVTLRIAHRNGTPGKPCMNMHDQRTMLSTVSGGNIFKDRSLEKSFLFTSVREPRRRLISQIFFTYVSRRGMEPTDKNIINKMKRRIGAKKKKLSVGFQTNFLSMRHGNNVTNYGSQWLREIVSEIVNDYDFLIITERMDESLVTLSFLLDVDLKDVIYLSAKVNGGYDGGPKGNCTKILKPFVSPKVEEYMNSDQFEKRNAGDVLLYRVANLCLDATIENIGRGKFETKLKEYRKLMKLAHEKCASEAIFPCSEDGVYNQETNCYFVDSGCGYPCLDKLVETL